ncbi:transketolase family protein [Caldisalinibacter kiritimatiensis]|uniref:Transketolase, alpha-subunit n=1 Tax=Caldisalinibacter kiritimatiensis TaxID=1304284 RepID=R1CTK9_9FIRM|nr:transketolase C-terminal domain-containing protein [Caldisalinibacter kiritimatiensis]EOD00009.1 Transketolase, alpha-subunit [Caldisalinibacter kiritimatiensis]
MTKIMAPRDMHGKVLEELGEENDKIFVLSGDLAAATKVVYFGRKFPDRFLNVGIAEQNMIGIAAGLARVGFIPIVSTFACFAPGRTYDQIRQVIAYSNANVKIMSTHPGLAIGMDGAIHQSLDDIDLMRELPNLVVLAPSDEISTKKAIIKAIEHNGPVYVRIGRKECPTHFSEDKEFEIGKGYTLKGGNDITFMAHGSMVDIMYKAAVEMEKMGVSVRVIEMPSIKPIDKELILKAATETKGIVTGEDHFLYGGLYSAVCEVVSSKIPCIVKGVAVNDTFGESGKPDELYKKYGLTKENVIEKAKEILNI